MLEIARFKVSGRLFQGGRYLDKFIRMNGFLHMNVEKEMEEA